MLRVLRKKVGDTQLFFDGAGHRFEGKITLAETSTNRVEGAIVQWLEVETPKASVVLVQGVPKGPKWDYVIEKATELGVDAIIPFLGETSPIDLDSKATASKEERWNRLAQSAAKQCDRPTVPIVHRPQTLFNQEQVLEGGTLLVCALDPSAEPIKTVLDSIKSDAGRYFVVVGPESGFSKDEMVWLKAKKARFISLGKLTLRTETAGLVALTLVRHIVGDL